MRRVAITGFGVVSPVGIGREAFWDSLSLGKGGVGFITHFDASTFEVQLAGEVKEPLDLPGNVSDIAAKDSKVGFAFAACREAMEQAGITSLDKFTAFHLGAGLEIINMDKVVTGGNINFSAVVTKALTDKLPPLQIPLDTTARLIQQTYGIAQSAQTNCSACAAGAQAIGRGYMAVRAGRSEIAVCGAFDSMINPLGVGGFQLLGALTIDNQREVNACRPFDIERSGAVLGEGAAAFILEPLEKARAEGKEILAEICGYGSSLDAHSLSAPDPEGDGAYRAMVTALKDAQLSPESVGHINTHGTGTALNDEVEARAIRALFPNWENIPVSSTKSITGHLIAAAGAVEAGATLLPLIRDILPPNISLAKVAPGCELNHVRETGQTFDGEYALSNSFGFGGQNGVLIFRRSS